MCLRGVIAKTKKKKKLKNVYNKWPIHWYTDAHFMLAHRVSVYRRIEVKLLFCIGLYFITSNTRVPYCIHTHITGHYNPSVRIVSHTTYVVCVNFYTQF